MAQPAENNHCSCGLYRWDGGCLWEAQDHDYVDMALAMGVHRFCPRCRDRLTWKGTVTPQGYTLAKQIHIESTGVWEMYEAEGEPLVKAALFGAFIVLERISRSLC